MEDADIARNVAAFTLNRRCAQRNTGDGVTIEFLSSG